MFICVHLWTLLHMHSPLVERVQDRIDLFGREILVIHVIDLHHRAAGTGCQAFLFLLQVELAIWSRLSPFNTQLILNVMHDLFTTVVAAPGGDVRVDQNKDGSLDRAEVKAFNAEMDKRMQEMRQRMQQQGYGQQGMPRP